MEITFKNVTLITNRNTDLEKTLLKNLDFSIKEIGIYGILGNSNSGKTSILELINALVKPTRGSVDICNFRNDLKKIKNINALRFDVGYVFKNPSDMFITKSVKTELEFGLKYFKYKYNKKSTRVVDALKLVGLNQEYLEKNPFDLSESEQKKVALASVLIFNPKIILLDEPSLHLNSKEKKDLVRLLKLLKNKYNKTILIASKDTEFLYDLVDYIYVMEKCVLINQGKKEILEDYEFLKKHDFKIPSVVEFCYFAKKHDKDFENYENIKDLIKGVYRSVF